MENRPTCCIDLLRKEMEIRNYSPRSVRTYADLLVAMSTRLKVPVDQIIVDLFNDVCGMRKKMKLEDVKNPTLEEVEGWLA